MLGLCGGLLIASVFFSLDYLDAREYGGPYAPHVLSYLGTHFVRFFPAAILCGIGLSALIHRLRVSPLRAIPLGMGASLASGFLSNFLVTVVAGGFAHGEPGDALLSIAGYSVFAGLFGSPAWVVIACLLALIDRRARAPHNSAEAPRP